MEMFTYGYITTTTASLTHTTQSCSSVNKDTPQVNKLIFLTAYIEYTLGSHRGGGREGAKLNYTCGETFL